MSTWINPKTGDYMRVNGALVADPTGGIANAVWLRLATPLGGYWADPTLGSRLHELRREKDVPRVYGLAVQYAQDALKGLVDSERVASVQVTAAKIRTGMLRLVIQVQTLAGDVVTFQHFVRVG